MTTLGGGIITDPHATRRARPWPVAGASVEQRLHLLLEEAGSAGLDAQSLTVRLGVSHDRVDQLGTQAVCVRIGDRILAPAALASVAESLNAELTAYHAANPLEPGAPLQLIRSRVNALAQVIDRAVDDASARGDIELASGAVRLAGWTTTLTDADRDAIARLLAEIRGAGAEPPSVAELIACYGESTEAFLRILERDGAVIQVEPARYYASDTVSDLIARLRTGMTAGSAHGPGALRDMLGFSRKFLIPFLEYCDRLGYTARQPDGRIWVGAGAGQSRGR